MSAGDESRIVIDGLKPADVALLKKVAEEAAAKAASEILVKLGIDPNNPFEAQADMQFLRSWRQASATVKKQSLMTAVIILTTGLLGLVWLALGKH